MTLIASAVVIALIAVSLYVVVKRHEESKAKTREQARRIELDRVMRLTHDLHKKGPKGIQKAS